MTEVQTDVQTSEASKTVIRPNLQNYVRAKSGTGKRTHRIDDFTARTLDGKSLDSIKEGANVLGINHTKWSHLNPGQQRMLIGNAIRSRLTAKKEEDRLSESAVTDVFGEPSAPYDAEADAAAKEAAAAERAAKKAAKEAEKAAKEAERAAKAAAIEEGSEASGEAEPAEGKSHRFGGKSKKSK